MFNEKYNVNLGEHTRMCATYIYNGKRLAVQMV